VFTQQAQNLAVLFSQLGNGSLSQQAMQAFANCAQALQTRGPVSINGAGGSKAPRAGVITNWPNSGNGQWNQYGGGAWNNQDPTSPPTNDGNYWGGDTYYGDTNLNNTFNTNLGDWYQQTFTDNSYNDFSTRLQTTTNDYSQTVNNFQGDNYFDNSTTLNNTVNNNVTNQGPVVNQGPVTNEGDVYNNNNTYLTENTYINTTEGPIDITQFIFNVIVQIFVGGGGKGGGPVGRIPQQIPNLKGTATVKIPADFELTDDCKITFKEKDVPVEVKIEPVRRDIGR
jgi:hypothetical protein